MPEGYPPDVSGLADRGVPRGASQINDNHSCKRVQDPAYRFVVILVIIKEVACVMQTTSFYYFKRAVN